MILGSEEHVIRLERHDVRMVSWMCNFRLVDRISEEELRTRQEMKSMREYMQDRRL